MSWGNADSKTATGTVTIAANGLVTGSSTAFNTQVSEGDYIRSNDEDYIVVSVTNSTVLHVGAAIVGGTVNAVSAGNAYTLSTKPKYVTTSEALSATTGHPELVFGVDAAEAAVNPDIPHAGWVRRIEGSGGRANRVTYEVLVAFGSITGDQSDDTEFPDS